jgi:hypothetical protein
VSSPASKSCEECGDSFTPSKYAVKRAKFCSPRCGDRNHRAHNREMHNAKSRRWSRRNPAADRQVRRRAELKSKYGITPEDYERMFAEQGGCCAVCRRPPERAPTRSGGYLCVDHDHVTGEVRGLLCGHCNAVLGYAEDSPMVLRSAIHYLEETTYAPAMD